MKHAPSNTKKDKLEKDQKQGVPSIFGSNPRIRRRSMGFTIVELMVVIGIIVLLLGIGVVAGARFIAEGKKEQNRAMLVGLLGASEEYKAQRQSAVNHDGKSPVDWSKVSNGSALSSSERFVYACSQIDAVAQQLNAAVTSSGSKSMERIYKDSTAGDADKVNEIYDTWGTQIEYRSYNDGTGRGPVTNVSNDLLPLSKHPFFVSAGPDKKFGPQSDGTNDDITTIENPSYK